MPSRHVLSITAALLLPLAFTGALLLPLPALAAETLWSEITVRVYEGTGAVPDERNAALKIAGSIISSASVEVVWRACSGSSTPGPSPDSRRIDPCRAPLSAGELSLRIVRSGEAIDDDHRALPLGEALIDSRARTGVLATVYADRVDWMAKRTGVPPHELLGRAIAHELGHLLMATSAHATHGLMRPVWSQSEVRRQRTSDWSFKPREIAAIRVRARTRQATALTELALLR